MSTALLDTALTGTGPRVRTIMAGARVIANLSGNQADAGRNRAGRALPPATIVGTPVFSAARASLSGAAHITFSGIEETASLTILAVMRPTGDLAQTAGRPTVAGWFDNAASPRGTGIYISSAMNLRASFEVSVAGVITTLFCNIGSYAAGELSTERMIALTITDGVGATLHDLTKAVSITTSNTNPRAPSTGRGFRLGAPHTSGAVASQSVNIAGAVLFTGSLTKAQIDTHAGARARYYRDVVGVTGLIPGV